MRILVCGDWHGNLTHAKQMVELAHFEHITTILHVGDFGYWAHTKDGRTYLSELNRHLVDLGILLVFIDGNHENHPLLRQQPVMDNGFAIIRGYKDEQSSIFYAPRGHRWEWDGVSFLAVGGAYSVDKMYRKAGTSWWPEEELDDDDIDRCLAGGDVDIMVSHDAPEGAMGVLGPNPFMGGRAFPEADHHRQKVARVFHGVHPKLVLTGHYHHRNSTVLFGVPIETFANDGTGADSWGILDLDEFKRKFKKGKDV